MYLYYQISPVQSADVNLGPRRLAAKITLTERRKSRIASANLIFKSAGIKNTPLVPEYSRFTYIRTDKKQRIHFLWPPRTHVRAPLTFTTGPGLFIIIFYFFFSQRRVTKIFVLLLYPSRYVTIRIFKSSACLWLRLGDRKPRTMSEKVAANRPGRRASKGNYFTANNDDKPAGNSNDWVIENAFCLSAFMGGAVFELRTNNAIIEGIR